MENKKIIESLKQHRVEIINTLSANNWRHFRYYFLIKERYLSNNIDDQFERVFCGFYIMNGARGLTKQQKKEFFKLLSSRENDLEKILKSLYKVPGFKNSRRIFLSFGTKLLHTINEKLPIYDGNISYVLELPSQTYPASFEEKIKNRIDIYKTLKEKFDILLADVKIKNFITSIRQVLQNKAELNKFIWQNKYISDTKLLDSLLWALYSNLK
ncbi:MAG: hypothetical protein EXS48_03125 [Candidatus Staskawiczbacteria bacterium]|nr:hypothetical protein [Candidatus Staskawiczbacteria bacterium]